MLLLSCFPPCLNIPYEACKHSSLMKTNIFMTGWWVFLCRKVFSVSNLRITTDVLQFWEIIYFQGFWLRLMSPLQQKWAQASFLPLGGSDQSQPPSCPDAPAPLHEELHPTGCLWGQRAASHEPRPPGWPLHFLPHYTHQDRPPMVRKKCFIFLCSFFFLSTPLHGDWGCRTNQDMQQWWIMSRFTWKIRAHIQTLKMIPCFLIC